MKISAVTDLPVASSPGRGLAFQASTAIVLGICQPWTAFCQATVLLVGHIYEVEKAEKAKKAGQFPSYLSFEYL